MGTLHKTRQGFTIIEVLLFFAVSSALAVGILGSSSVAINNQRYSDAVTSFKNLIQGEVIAATRVVNTKLGTSECPQDNTTSPSGTSDCVIMGRAIGIREGNTAIVANIVGKPGAAPFIKTDEEFIKSYSPVIDMNTQETSPLNWGTYIRRSNGEAEYLVILIFRSPESGSVVIRTARNVTDNNYDFDNDYMTTTSNLLYAFNNSGTGDKQEICVDPSGWTIAQSQGIVISARASGPSGIEQLSGAGC